MNDKSAIFIQSDEAMRNTATYNLRIHAVSSIRDLWEI